MQVNRETLRTFGAILRESMNFARLSPVQEGLLLEEFHMRLSEKVGEEKCNVFLKTATSQSS